MDNKKVLIISVISVIALVIAIVGTSYAMFTANLTGTKENVINTGYVKMSCAETTFNVQNSSPMSDSEGIASTDNAATCTLTTEMKSTMRICYDVALYEVDALTPSDSIGISNVKAQIYKSVDSGPATYLGGSSASSGVLINTLTSSSGTYDSSITSYNIDSAIVEGSQTVVYTIKNWVDSTASSGTNSSSNPGTCSDSTYTDESTCEAAGEIWGSSQTESQQGGSFSFKLKIGATQVLS